MGLSAARLRQACASAADRRYLLLCRRARGGGGHVDVVLARDADDADVTEAFAAAMLTCSAVPLPTVQVTMVTTLACSPFPQYLAKRHAKQHFSTEPQLRPHRDAKARKEVKP